MLGISLQPFIQYYKNFHYIRTFRLQYTQIFTIGNCTIIPAIKKQWKKFGKIIYLCMMTSSNGNIFRITGPLCGEFTGPGEFPSQRPVTRSFVVFFDLRLNKRLSKQPWGWWFETPSWSLWRHRNGLIVDDEVSDVTSSSGSRYNKDCKKNSPKYPWMYPLPQTRQIWRIW